jgi:hypothetical protein
VDHTKQLVTATRSIFSFVIGFQQFGYIAIMLSAGLSTLQVGLLLALNTLFTVIFLLFLLIHSHFRHALTISYSLSALVFLTLLLYPHFYGFLVNSAIIGLANAIYSSVIIQMVNFTKKEISSYMTLSVFLSGGGVAYYYASTGVSVYYLVGGLLAVIIVNSVLAYFIPVTQRDINLKESLKAIAKPTILFITFTGAFRRVVLMTLLPLIIYEIIHIDLLSLTPYYVLLTLVPVPFLLVSYKLSNRIFLLVSVMTGILVLLMGFAKSLLLLISLVIGLRVLHALTGPTGEYTIIQYIKGSTRIFSGIELIDNAFVFSGTAVVAFLISANDYLPVFIALFLIELLGGVVIFRIIQNLEHDKIPKEN